jgi:hypothetical protein
VRENILDFALQSKNCSGQKLILNHHLHEGGDHFTLRALRILVVTRTTCLCGGCADQDCLVGPAVWGCCMGGCGDGVWILPPFELQQETSESVLEQSHVLCPAQFPSYGAALVKARRRAAFCPRLACRQQRFSRSYAQRSNDGNRRRWLT